MHHATQRPLSTICRSFSMSSSELLLSSNQKRPGLVKDTEYLPWWFDGYIIGSKFVLAHWKFSFEGSNICKVFGSKIFWRIISEIPQNLCPPARFLCWRMFREWSSLKSKFNISSPSTSVFDLACWIVYHIQREEIRACTM